MQIILYLSVALIAIAFTVLVAYIIQTLKSLKTTLDNVSKTIVDLEQQLDGVTTETTSLLEKTNNLAEDLQNKSASLNSVVDSAKNVGTTVDSFNKSLQSISESVATKVAENENRIAQIAQVGLILVEFRDKFKNRKAKQENRAEE